MKSSGHPCSSFLGGSLDNAVGICIVGIGSLLDPSLHSGWAKLVRFPYLLFSRVSTPPNTG